MSDWKVELIGDRFDLEDLPDWFSEGGIKIETSDGKYFLLSNTFEELTEESEIRTEANRLVKLINGIGRVYRENLQTIGIGAIYGTDASGREVIFEFVKEIITIRDKHSDTITENNGVVKKDSYTFQFDKIRKLLQKDVQVKMVFDYLSKPAMNWNYLYCILDAIEEDIDKPVWKEKWASRKSVELFTRTACSYKAIGVKARHAKSKIKPPEKPMKDQEASHLILKIVKQWLENKLS